jgi:hypothetical protein
MTTQPAVSRFWNWFAENHRNISDAYNNSDYDWLSANISRRIRQLSDSLNWEIGPYHFPDSTFVLSPTIRENLSLTREAVKSAPQISGWRFLHAKPRKTLKRLLFESHGCTVDAENWRYQLVSYNKGEFVDLLLYINATGFPLAHDQLFAELVVESLVGEELRLDRIGVVQPNIVENTGELENLTPIRYLYEHLLTVLTPDENRGF